MSPGSRSYRRAGRRLTGVRRDAATDLGVGLCLHGEPSKSQVLTEESGHGDEHMNKESHGQKRDRNTTLARSREGLKASVVRDISSSHPYLASFGHVGTRSWCPGLAEGGER